MSMPPHTFSKKGSSTTRSSSAHAEAALSQIASSTNQPVAADIPKPTEQPHTSLPPPPSRLLSATCEPAAARGSRLQSDPFLPVCIHPSPPAGSQWWLPQLSLSWVPWFAVRTPPKNYGTRSSTVVLVDAKGRFKVVERYRSEENGDAGEEEARVHMGQVERNTFEFCDV